MLPLDVEECGFGDYHVRKRCAIVCVRAHRRSCPSTACIPALGLNAFRETMRDGHGFCKYSANTGGAFPEEWSGESERLDPHAPRFEGGLLIPECFRWLGLSSAPGRGSG